MKIKNCRFCGHKNLNLFLDLGYCQPADQFLSIPFSKSNAKTYPLEVVKCDNCHLVQLSYTCSGEILYQQDYPYESDITKQGRTHWKEFAKDVVKRFALGSNDLVIDIGSNVGELLSNFKNEKVKVQGIDPAANIAQKAEKRGIPTINTFFNKTIINILKKKNLHPKVITGTNVFAHIDDISGSLNVVKTILLPDGIFIIEAPYLKNLIDGLEYDTIYHEHLSYISITPLEVLFKKFELEIFDIDFQKIHGGSIRVFVQHKNGVHERSQKVQMILDKEEKQNIHDINYLRKFAEKVVDHKVQITSLLNKLKREGKRIAAVGAPAKGMTLLNYCNIDKNLLEFVTEVSKLKINKYCPGTDLKIIGDNELIKQNIDYALILPWNFKDEIMGNLKEFRDGGGKFIIPLPKVTVL